MAGRTDSKKYGVYYGAEMSHPPDPNRVVQELQDKGIKNIWLSEPVPNLLEALQGQDITVTLGVPNSEVPDIARHPCRAEVWVQDNIGRYSSLRFEHVCVGDMSSMDIGKYQELITAMDKIANCKEIKKGDIKVTTVVDPSNLFPKYNFIGHPSNYRFFPHCKFSRIINDLVRRRAPLFIRAFPYFEIPGDVPSHPNLTLGNFLIDEKASAYMDNYRFVFDAMVDSVYTAVNALGGLDENVSLVVATGWPKAGGKYATPNFQKQYLDNVNRHIKEGTPMVPDFQVFVWSAFDEGKLVWKPEPWKNLGIYNAPLPPPTTTAAVP